MIEVSRVWKRYRIQEFRTLYGRVAEWSRLIREVLRSPAEDGGHEEFWALREVSLEVKQGEILGVIGSNGAGKTTLLRLLAGISKPTRGYVRVKGRVGALISVGAGFHPELTGRENIYLNGAIMGMSRREVEQKFDEIVQFAEIDRFVDTPLKHYSSGMSVRLGFAIAAHLEPDVLLVDEILSVGDTRFRRKSYERMTQLFRSGVTIVFVSHSLRAVERLCDKAVLLNRGQIICAGAAAEVVNYYLNEVVAVVRSQRPDRVGVASFVPGPVQVEEVELLGENSRRADALKCGLDGTVKIHLNVQNDMESYLKCTLVVSTLDDMVVASLPSPAFDQLKKGRHVAVCKLHRVPILPGTYRLDLRLNIEGRRYDWPLGDLVVKSDVKYTAGDAQAEKRADQSLLSHLRSNLSGEGVVFVPHSWACAVERPRIAVEAREEL